MRTLDARGLVARLHGAGSRHDVEAVEVLAKSAADRLVTSDIVMPGMDSPTWRVNYAHRNTDLKIIFVSGYAEDTFQRTCPSTPIHLFLPDTLHAQSIRRRRGTLTT